jgi:hypothetical protein
MVRLEFAVIVNGLSVEDVPVHPVKIYSESGVAVIISLEPDAKEPPVLFTEPPSDAEALILNKTNGASVCSSNASFLHVISRKKANEKSRIFFINSESDL